jgi:hypothetical protein
MARPPPALVLGDDRKKVEGFSTSIQRQCGLPTAMSPMPKSTVVMPGGWSCPIRA